MQWRLNWDPILSKSSPHLFRVGFPEVDILFNRSDGSETGGKSSKKRASEGKLAALKAELNHALSKPLVARGVSLRYITSGTRAIADDLIAGNSKCSLAVLLKGILTVYFYKDHETMLGLSKLKAGAEVVKTRKTKK